MAVLITLGLMILAPVVVWLVVGVVAAPFGATEDGFNSFLNSDHGILIASVVSYIGMLGFLFWILKATKTDIRGLIGLRRPKLSDVGYGILGFGIALVLEVAAYTLITAPLKLDSGGEQNIGFDSINRDNLVYAVMALAILPPIVEEVIFRGFLFGSFRSKKMRLWLAIVLSSIFFGALHVFGSSKDGSNLWAAGIDVAALALVLAYMREKTGAIWTPIIIHATKNSLALIALFAGLS